MPKTNPQRLAGLTAEEQSDYEWTIHIMDVYMGPRKERLTELEVERLSIARRVSRYFERLSRSRALLKKHEWLEYRGGYGCSYCPECGRESIYGHTSDCAIAAELAGMVEPIRRKGE